MPKFISNSTTHTASGEWDFENHGPDASNNVCILPNGSILPIVTLNDGQIFFVPASGILAMTQGGIWKVVTGS